MKRALYEVMRLAAAFYEKHHYDAARRPERFSMGRYSYSLPRVIAYEWDQARLTIGSFCSIAPDATFVLGGNHRPDWVSTFPFRIRFGLPEAAVEGSLASKGDIVVGHDVWIGRGALILSGSRIGDGAVIGAHAVVAGKVRPYAVVVGNPAREVRRRFSDDQVAALEAIAWWDWPLEDILANVHLIGSDGVDPFIDRFRKSGAA